MLEPQSPGLLWLLAAIPNATDDCLPWPYSTCTAGYGHFKAYGKKRLAHRYVCELTHGKPPGHGYQASHSCGNRRCVNPKHLRWKTPKDNQLDRRDHGTMNKTSSKINATQAAQIRQLRGLETSVTTAAKYGITESNVRLIQDGKIWRATRKIPLPLTPDQVRTIRRIGYNQSAKDIAKELGVSLGAVHRCRVGDYFKNVV